MRGRRTESRPRGFDCLPLSPPVAVGDEATPVVVVVSAGQVPQALPAIAHELSEALTAISAYLTGGRQMWERADEARFDRVQEILDRAHAQAMRANEALRQLRDILAR